MCSFCISEHLCAVACVRTTYLSKLVDTNHGAARLVVEAARRLEVCAVAQQPLFVIDHLSPARRHVYSQEQLRGRPNSRLARADTHAPAVLRGQQPNTYDGPAARLAAPSPLWSNFTNICSISARAKARRWHCHPNGQCLRFPRNVTNRSSQYTLTSSNIHGMNLKAHPPCQCSAGRRRATDEEWRVRYLRLRVRSLRDARTAP